MIPLLFTLLFAEMTLIVLLLFRSPVRVLVIMGLDRLKQGRGPLVARTVATTILVVFSSSLYGAIDIHKRSKEAGGLVNSTDEVLMAYRILEASLMGFSLFLAMITDRIHYYIRELDLVRNNMGAVERLNQEYKDRIRKQIVETETKPKIGKGSMDD
ncbi:hypothetical protein CFOL_v3_33061 [Cephalotus follicularis]|uniref:Endoplasmic reticulum transmembrane protein n=1 Tax=Cephalotus follicularis TaxID=3775 RepID=A0A1Q3DAX8_CEPFO|nr:hypothetical protein CFOL_v3_33061 [Cephalotus follicularis]